MSELEGGEKGEVFAESYNKEVCAQYKVFAELVTPLAAKLAGKKVSAKYTPGYRRMIRGGPDYAHHRDHIEPCSLKWA